MSLPLVIGLGSFCGDDQAGWLIITGLQELNYPAGRLLRLEHASRLLDFCGTESQLIICDACVSRDTVGVVHQFDGSEDVLMYERPSGSHDLGVPEVVQLLKQLSDTAPRIQVWAVEGAEWTPETPPSSAVQSAARAVAQRIFDMVSRSP